MARLKVEASTTAGPGMRQVYETALGKQILNHYRANKDLFGEVKVLRDEECVGAMRAPSRDGCCSVMRRKFVLCRQAPWSSGWGDTDRNPPYFSYACVSHTTELIKQKIGGRRPRGSREALHCGGAARRRA